MRAVFIKEFRELARDHRTLAMLVVLPIVLLTVFGYAANFAVQSIKVGVIGPDAQPVSRELKLIETSLSDFDIHVVNQELLEDTPTTLLRDQEYDAVVVTSDESPERGLLAERTHIYVDGSRLFTAMSAQRTFMEVMAEDVKRQLEEFRADARSAQIQGKQARQDIEKFEAELLQFQDAIQDSIQNGSALPAPPSPPSVPTILEGPDVNIEALSPDSLITILYNPDLKTSWVMVPGLIGLILTFIGVLITSIGLVRERESGTLEQLGVMPLRPSSIILGKTAPYFMLALLDMVIISCIGIWLFHVPFEGSIWLFSLSSIVFLFVVLGLGVLISTVSQTTGQAIQMAVMFVMPQILLSGLIFPLNSMAVGVRWIGYILPLTWFLEITTGIMLRDATVATLWFPLAILTGQAILIFGVATARMRYALTHGDAR